MNEPETLIRKVGRPSTRMSTRGRLNSLGSHPSSPIQIRIPSPLVEIPDITPVINLDVNVPQDIRNVDLVVIPTDDGGNAEPQIPRDKPAAPSAAPNPRDVPQQSRGVDPGTRNPNPTGANNNARGHPPPPADAPPNDIPRVDPKRQLRKQAQKIVKECQDFLEIYKGIQLNPPLLIQLVAESNKLLIKLSNCDD